MYVSLDSLHYNYRTAPLDNRKFQVSFDVLNQARKFSNEELEEGISNRVSFSQLSFRA